MPRRRLRRAPDPAPAPLVGAEDEPVDSSPEHQLERWFATQARPVLPPPTDPAAAPGPLAVARDAIGTADPPPPGTTTDAPPDPIGQLRAALAPPAEPVSPGDVGEAARQTDPLAVARTALGVAHPVPVEAPVDVPEDVGDVAAEPEDGFTPLDDPNWTAHLAASAAAPVAAQIATETPLPEAGPPPEPVPDATPEPEPGQPAAEEPTPPEDPVAEDAATDLAPVALALPTSMVEPREAAHHPHHQATHAAPPVPSGRPVSTPTPPTPAPRPEDPDAVEFRSSETPRRLLGAAFVVAAIGSVLAIFALVDNGTGSALLLSAVLVAASLSLWWALVSWSPTIVSIRHGILEVARGADTNTYDLRDPDTTVETRGTPRSPSWRAVVTTRSGRRVVVNRHQVRPSRFTEIVERHRDAPVRAEQDAAVPYPDVP